LSSIEDELIQSLLYYRQALDQQNRNSKIDGQAIWRDIARRTGASNRSERRILSLNKLTKWAIAASIILAALLSFYYINFSQKPQLVAQADTAIKSVQLEDGSKVTLRPHSKLFETFSDSRSERYKLEGEAYFEVVHNPERLFSVQAANGSVSVLGTRFMLSSWGEKMRVYLEEGSVKIETQKRDSTVILSPGQSTIINKKGMISPIQNSADAKEFIDWLQQQLIFKSKPAEFIAEELEQQFNISIILPKQTKKITLSGSLSLKNLQISLDDLGLVMGGKFIKKSDRVYVFKSN